MKNETLTHRIIIQNLKNVRLTDLSVYESGLFQVNSSFKKTGLLFSFLAALLISFVFSLHVHAEDSSHLNPKCNYCQFSKTEKVLITNHQHLISVFVFDESFFSDSSSFNVNLFKSTTHSRAPPLL